MQSLIYHIVTKFVLYLKHLGELLMILSVEAPEKVLYGGYTSQPAYTSSERSYSDVVLTF